VSLIHSQQVQKLDQLFELALEKPVIVNLPGNVHDATKNWLSESDLLSKESIAETGVSFCKWFLSDGSNTSVDLFAKSLEDYEGKLPHILVVNQGLNPYWSKDYLTDKLKDLAQKYQYLALDFPGLAIAERNYIKQNNICFSKALKDKKLSILSRQRLVKFLRNTMSQIEQVYSISNLNDNAIALVETAPSSVVTVEPETTTAPFIASEAVGTTSSNPAKKSTTSKSRSKQAKNAVVTEDKADLTVESAS
jgi:hypothetical protein